MSDTCQTPGCGHAKSLHHNSMGACVRVNPRCPCTRYTAPDETVSECHHTLFINTHRCTKCGVEVPWDYRPPTREQVLADAHASPAVQFPTGRPTQEEPMTAARDELVDVIAEALRAERTHYNSRLHADKIASMAVAALVSRYGEPEIEGRKWYQFGALSEAEHQHRLVFPWKAVAK